MTLFLRALTSQPDEIALTRVPGDRWKDPAAAGRLAVPLREKGFVDLGLYTIKPSLGFRVGVMLNERAQTAAFLTEYPTGSVALELSVRYADGTTTALVNYPDNGVPRPPFFRVIFAGPEKSSGELFERLMRERPSSGIKMITAETVVPEFVAAYARIVKFTKGMGLTSGQVADIVSRARKPAGYIPAPKPAAPAQADPAATDVPCPHCGRLNEREREVCWACAKLMNGLDKPVVAPPSSQDQPNGPVPFPLRAELVVGERVLWHGRPVDQVDLRDYPLMAFPIGLFSVFAAFFFLRFAGPWRPVSAQPLSYLTANSFVLIVSAFFFMAGLIVTLGPFLRRVLRRGAFYAVTDQRALLVYERPFHRVVARDLIRLTMAAVVSETFEGAGTVELGFDCWTVAGADFEFIENAREVAALLHMARQEALARLTSGPRAGDAPESLARLIVPLHYATIALSLLLLLSDLAAIVRTGGRILASWGASPDRGSWPPAAALLVAPIMIYFVYSRAKKFQAGTRTARAADVSVMALVVGFGCALLWWGDALALSRTLCYALLGVFLLPGASGRPSTARDV